MVPGEVLKTRMQTGMVSSLTEGVASILKTEGIGNFFINEALY